MNDDFVKIRGSVVLTAQLRDCVIEVATADRKPLPFPMGRKILEQGGRVGMNLPQGSKCRKIKRIIYEC